MLKKLIKRALLIAASLLTVFSVATSVNSNNVNAARRHARTTHVRRRRVVRHHRVRRRRTKRHFVYYVAQTTGQYNHYLKLAQRPGTHYFKHAIRLQSWEGETTGDGKDDTGANSVGYEVIIGTKTIGNKHYFITSNEYKRKAEGLATIKSFHVPTAYEVKPGQTIKIYDTTEDGLNTWVHMYTWKGGHHLLVYNPNTITGVKCHNGEKYVAIDDNDALGGYIKASDMSKLKLSTYRGSVVHLNGHHLTWVNWDSYYSRKMTHVMD